MLNLKAMHVIAIAMLLLAMKLATSQIKSGHISSACYNKNGNLTINKTDSSTSTFLFSSFPVSCTRNMFIAFHCDTIVVIEVPKFNPCSDNAKCENLVGSFNWLCEEGHEGDRKRDGTRCNPKEDDGDHTLRLAVPLVKSFILELFLH
ncbi:hypothetical protein FEM48_Zijuj01G0322200 [Ziziphus jujuba var. spinosa]|uniref:Uncharacterized protein n=1 Tax=Ziziphus jujuba var. spinosa TaxID=714518 RepID=A0A978W6H0_ZIZJJ|nr:hypothetical protein FEM48_Zijuj01G0322200 [Ziziphus jujuba var. spinosa]